jgi:hypothetical protein
MCKVLLLFCSCLAGSAPVGNDKLHIEFPKDANSWPALLETLCDQSGLPLVSCTVPRATQCVSELCGKKLPWREALKQINAALMKQNLVLLDKKNHLTIHYADRYQAWRPVFRGAADMEAGDEPVLGFFTVQHLQSEDVVATLRRHLPSADVRYLGTSKRFVLTERTGKLQDLLRAVRKTDRPGGKLVLPEWPENPLSDVARSPEQYVFLKQVDGARGEAAWYNIVRSNIPMRRKGPDGDLLFDLEDKPPLEGRVLEVAERSALVQMQGKHYEWRLGETLDLVLSRPLPASEPPKLAKRGPAKGISCQFWQLAWINVLNWTARVTDRAAPPEELRPTGTLTFLSPAGRRYAANELFDRLDEAMMEHGMGLLQNNRKLQIICATDLPKGFTPTEVRPEDLNRLPPRDWVQVRFPLKKWGAVDLVADVRSLIGGDNNVEADVENRLRVLERVAALRTVAAFLREVDK